MKEYVTNICYLIYLGDNFVTFFFLISGGPKKFLYAGPKRRNAGLEDEEGLPQFNYNYNSTKNNNGLYIKDLLIREYDFETMRAQQLAFSQL